MSLDGTGHIKSGIIKFRIRNVPSHSLPALRWPRNCNFMGSSVVCLSPSLLRCQALNNHKKKKKPPGNESLSLHGRPCRIKSSSAEQLKGETGDRRRPRVVLCCDLSTTERAFNGHTAECVTLSHSLVIPSHPTVPDLQYTREH